MEDGGPSSLWYEFTRRFIRSKEFETPFALKLLADMLNEVVAGGKTAHLPLSLPIDVKRHEEEEEVVNKSEPRFDSSREDLTDISNSTVIYSMDEYRKKGTRQGDAADKEKFLKSESSSCEDDSSVEGFGRRKRVNGPRKSPAEEKEELEGGGDEKGEQEGGDEKEEQEGGDEKEDGELEKLLRMGVVNPHRGKASSSEEEETEEGKRKKVNLKTPEVRLVDCLEPNWGVEDVCQPQSEDDKKREMDFESMANIEAKASFLLTSSEGEVSEIEEEAKPKKVNKKSNEEKAKESKGSKTNMVPETSEEDEEGEVVATEVEVKLSSGSEDEYVPEEKESESGGNSGSESPDILSVTVETECSPSKGRRNIQKILRKEHLQLETKQALRMENERKKRLRERSKLFEELYPDVNSQVKLVLDFDPDTKEALVVVDEELGKKLKPHQREGVRFMWNCCFESLKRLEEDSGSGCILAHCMGLGKTLQVITLSHTILTQGTGVQTILVMCPLNTVRNWIQEFKIWLKGCSKRIRQYDLIRCRNDFDRKCRVSTWIKEGGVLVISYEMFRSLVKREGQLTNNLVDPGPDVVVCDEGHVLKNENSALSKCMSRIKTLRRIILTGTPLQNNLLEYYCMVQFVKPNILGTKKEFCNRFVNPITNGQFEDSTEYDVKVMKRRSHVLHSMLDGFIQRFGYYVLTPFLPEKQEYVISITLTDAQEKIYRMFTERCLKENRGLFKDFHWAQKIWTHPRLIVRHSEKHNTEEVLTNWKDYVEEAAYEDIRSSGKLFLLFSILQRCTQMGDKVLVFSQSLYSLELIEYFLRKLNQDHEKGVQSEFADSWVYGQDYFRLDGSKKSDIRESDCRKFNNPGDKRSRLFLISTRAGGLGINLVAANRVVVFDASWNPTHDVQSIFRVYRFGQTKPCYIYRFLAAATMEEKIYRRQVTKLSLAHRILDEHQIERHYSMGNLQELYRFEPIPKSEWRIPKVPKDPVFADILSANRDIIVGYHEHDSLLENKEAEELTEEERRAAWEDFEKEKLPPQPQPTNGVVPVNRPNVVERLNSEGLRVVQNYNQAILPRKPEFLFVNQSQNQICRITEVRTLNPSRRDEEMLKRERMLALGRANGVQLFEDESVENYCRRVERSLHEACLWGTNRRDAGGNSTGS